MTFGLIHNVEDMTILSLLTPIKIKRLCLLTQLTFYPQVLKLLLFLLLGLDLTLSTRSRLALLLLTLFNLSNILRQSNLK